MHRLDKANLVKHEYDDASYTELQSSNLRKGPITWMSSALIRAIVDNTDLPEPESVGEIDVCQGSAEESLRRRRPRQNKLYIWGSVTHSSTEDEDERDDSESDLESFSSAPESDSVCH